MVIAAPEDLTGGKDADEDGGGWGWELQKGQGALAAEGAMAAGAYTRPLFGST
jgi:hypothetical protein